MLTGLSGISLTNMNMGCFLPSLLPLFLTDQPVLCKVSFEGYYNEKELSICDISKPNMEL